MPSERLTDTLVRRASPPEKGHKILWDSEVKGFGCRVTAGGAKAYVLNYRTGGRERRLTIGSYPDWSTPAARDEARRLKARVDLGEDPMGERHAERAAPTVEELTDEYFKRYAAVHKRESSIREDRDLSKHVLPKLGKVRVTEVTRRDVESLHRAMSDTPVRANRAYALVRKLMALAVEWGYREDNPAVGLRLYPEEPRTRYLSPDELTRLATALNEAAASERAGVRQSANVIRLLLLTGARRGEVLGATWKQFDLVAGVWTKPSSHVKQKREHRVPLSAAAIELLRTIRAETDGDYLFPARSTTETDKKETKEPQNNVAKFWKSLCRKAGIEDCHIHDLRHTYASILASAGLSLPVIGALLGHTQAATTQRYAHLMDEALRTATERVGAVVNAGMAGTQKATAG